MKERTLHPHLPAFSWHGSLTRNCCFYKLLFRLPSFSLAWLLNFCFLLDQNQSILSELV